MVKPDRRFVVIRFLLHKKIGSCNLHKGRVFSSLTNPYYMKKITTKILYVFSFSLLFTALYLNFVQKDKGNSFSTIEKKPTLSTAAFSENDAVAQPENNTVLK